jgi:PIN domain nuclease of toxin-antitoxin system
VTYVFDTHTLIWAVTGDPRLSSRAAAALRDVTRRETLAADVSLSEAARLIAAGRLTVQGNPLVWLRAFASRAQIVPLSPEIAWLAASLRWTHRDPSDRQIVATALLEGSPLVTVDRDITRAAADLGLTVIW